MLFTRCVACGWLLAATLAVACAGESTKREVFPTPGVSDETGQAGAGPDRPVFSELPVDFRSQCPAAGCTLKFQPTDISGVWSYCREQQLPAFDPSTFDFSTICAGAIKAYPVPPRPDDEDNIYFTDHGLEYRWGENSSYCLVESSFLTSNSELVTPDCWSGVSQVTALGFDRTGPLLHNGPDGSVYRYRASSSADGAWLSANPLATADTASLVAGCIAAPQMDYRCETDGVMFPFGPSGVGTPPDDRLARTWLVCYPNTDSDHDIVSACRDVLVSGGAIGYYHFNTDGTLDSFGAAGASPACRGATLGATATELNFFYCDTTPSMSGDVSSLGTGHIAAETTPYELRTIDGTDYLIWYGPNDFRSVAIAQPDLDPDPCAGAALPACVIGGTR